MRIYIDGIFDLFHIGHVKSFETCKKLNKNAVVIAGVIGDKTATAYKREPIIPELERFEIVKQCRHVDEVIFDAPLIVSEQFINENKIDLVVHGFYDSTDAAKQSEFFKVPIQLGKFKQIGYYLDQSTTKILKKIKHKY